MKKCLLLFVLLAGCQHGAEVTNVPTPRPRFEVISSSDFTNRYDDAQIKVIRDVETGRLYYLVSSIDNVQMLPVLPKED